MRVGDADADADADGDVDVDVRWACMSSDGVLMPVWCLIPSPPAPARDVRQAHGLVTARRNQDSRPCRCSRAGAHQNRQLDIVAAVTHSPLCQRFRGPRRRRLPSQWRPPTTRPPRRYCCSPRAWQPWSLTQWRLSRTTSTCTHWPSSPVRL